MADAVAKRALFGQTNQLLCLLYRDGEGLLAENMLACEQRLLCHLIMRGVGGADVDRVDRRVLEQLAIVVDHGFYTETSLRAVSPVQVHGRRSPATSTNSTRRSASRCTRPMNPVPMIAVLIRFTLTPVRGSAVLLIPTTLPLAAL